MSPAAEEIARDDQSGHALAEAWSLEYLKASAVSVDPRALSLLERGDCKRLRAIPLATGSGGAVVAVCAPSEERFTEIREVTGEQTRFVLISEGTMDALLGSRMFAEAAPASAGEDAAGARETEEIEGDASVDPGKGPAAAGRRKRPVEEESEPETEEPVPSAEAAPVDIDERDTGEALDEPAPDSDESAPSPEAAASEASVDSIVGAVLNALKRVGSAPEQPAAAAAVDLDAAEAAQLPTSTADLLAHLDATVQTWSSLRAMLADVHTEFEETKRALRETKEQLSVAHADNDQYRKRVRMLEGELAESRELVTQARTRLQEAAVLLETDPTQVEASAELL
jgi:MshEN domain